MAISSSTLNRPKCRSRPTRTKFTLRSISAKARYTKLPISSFKVTSRSARRKCARYCYSNRARHFRGKRSSIRSNESVIALATMVIHLPISIRYPILTASTRPRRSRCLSIPVGACIFAVSMCRAIRARATKLSGGKCANLSQPGTPTKKLRAQKRDSNVPASLKISTLKHHPFPAPMTKWI